MENIIGRVLYLYKEIRKLTNKQKSYKSFMEWEIWLETEFYPLYDEYEKLCIDISPKDHEYIDFKSIVDSMIRNDCEMICD
jgi:hypothetical protein